MENYAWYLWYMYMTLYVCRVSLGEGGGWGQEGHLKEDPPRASIANRDFPLLHVVRLLYAHYKLQIMLLCSGLH